MKSVNKSGGVAFSELMRTGRLAYTEAESYVDDVVIEARIPHIPHDEFLDAFGHVMSMAIRFGESPRWVPRLPEGEFFPTGVLQVVLFLMTHHTDDIKKIFEDHPEIASRIGRSHFLPEEGQCLED